jgi:hypothetical protein
MYSTGLFSTHLHDAMGKRIVFIPFGDVHCDSPHFSKRVWKRFVNRVQELEAEEKTQVVTLGMGDYTDLARGASRRLVKHIEREDHDQLIDAIQSSFIAAGDYFYDLFKPIEHTCMGFLEGNHYCEIKDDDGVIRTTTQRHCRMSNIPYLGTMSVIGLTLHRPSGDKGDSRSDNKRVVICAHHGKGAAQTAGGTLNRIEKMANKVRADITLMGHDHKRTLAPMDPVMTLTRTGKLQEVEPWICRTGSFLKSFVPGTISYAADAALTPTSLGWCEFHYVNKSNGGKRRWELHPQYGVA